MKYMVGFDKMVLDDDAIKHNIKLAVLAAHEKKFDEAFDILHKALELAQNRKNSSAENYVIDMLANLYYTKGEYGPAERLFTDLMRRLLTSGTPQNDPAMIEISLKLSDIYARAGDDEKAEIGFQFCVEAAKGNVFRADQEYATRWKQKTPNRATEVEYGYAEKESASDAYALYGLVLEVYSQYLAEKGRMEESVEAFNRCLELSYEIYGMSSEHTITILNNYAVVCLRKEAYQPAQKYMSESVERAERRPESADELPGYYCNYAEILWHTDQREKALEYARKADELARRREDQTMKDHTKQFLSTLETELRKKKRK